MLQPVEFNPLAYGSIQDSLFQALMSSEAIPLSEVTQFEGNGVYALFYRGDYPAYRPLACADGREVPIYVGKAAPSARKGEELTEVQLLGAYGGTALFTRMKNHRASIEAASNLAVEDFFVRLLVLSYIWVPLAETSVISRCQPLWNTVVDGFGNHDPGKGRRNSVRPRWDTLHPGRAWAAKLAERGESQEDIMQDIEGFFLQRAQLAGLDCEVRDDV